MLNSWMVIVVLVTRIALIIGDALVLAVTWVKTARTLIEGARIGMRTPLSTMLFRDGLSLSKLLCLINSISELCRRNDLFCASLLKLAYTLTITGTYCIAPIQHPSRDEYCSSGCEKRGAFVITLG